MADKETWGLSREEIDERLRKQNQAHNKKGKGRSQNQRLKLLYLLDYLLENTDETHTVKVQEIITHFENHHKIPIEQKTVCSDFECSNKCRHACAKRFGCCISYGRTGRYHVENRREIRNGTQ